MKKKITVLFSVIFIILIQKNLMAWDTTAAKFYPLNVGNVYVYDYISLWFNCDPFQFRQKYTVTINDFVLKPNGKRYYKFSGWWPVSGWTPSWKYQRIDSNSMNIYTYDSLTNSEFLIDSLLISSGNTFLCKRFNFQNPSGSCQSVSYQQIFGSQRLLKSLSTFSSIISPNYSIAEGIGFMGYSACELGSGTLYTLKGCVINGIVIGDTTLTRIEQINNYVPDNFSLSQNYPNPFNPITVIRYSLPVNRFITLKVYDVLGNEVATLVNEKQNVGSYSVEFDGTNYPSGIYYYKLEAEDFSYVRKMILVK